MNQDASDNNLGQFIARHTIPYDPDTDGYDRPPFAADIKEGKNDPMQPTKLCNASSSRTTPEKRSPLRNPFHPPLPTPRQQTRPSPLAAKTPDT